MLISLDIWLSMNYALQIHKNISGDFMASFVNEKMDLLYIPIGTKKEVKEQQHNLK